MLSQRGSHGLTNCQALQRPQRQPFSALHKTRGYPSITNESNAETPRAAPNEADVRDNGNGNTLLLNDIRCCHDGVIHWDELKELASLDLLFHLNMREGIMTDSLEVAMKNKGVALPDIFSSLDLIPMTNQAKRNSMNNVNLACGEFLAHLGGHFVIEQDEMLHKWQRDATRYSNGGQVEVDIMTTHPNSRRAICSQTTSYILLHINFFFNLPLKNIEPLWVCFYALIMHHVIPMKQFLDRNTIWNNIMPLWTADVKIASNRLKRSIRKRTKHVFPVYTYISSDNSKHFKQNRHVLILSEFEEDNPELDYIAVPFQPTFRLVTTSPNEVKTDTYMKNADDIIDIIGLEGAAYVNGGTNDNEGKFSF